MSSTDAAVATTPWALGDALSSVTKCCCVHRVVSGLLQPIDLNNRRPARELVADNGSTTRVGGGSTLVTALRGYGIATLKSDSRIYLLRFYSVAVDAVADTKRQSDA